MVDIKHLTIFVMDTAMVYNKFEEWQSEVDQELSQVQQYAKQYNVDLDNQSQLTNQKIMQNNNIKLNVNSPVTFNSLNLIQRKEKSSK